MNPFDGTEDPDDDEGRAAAALAQRPWVKWMLVAWTACMVACALGWWLKG